MTQCNNIQSTINHRTVFRQQFTQQFYECSVMWNVNRFQREVPGLSAAPSPKCPVCSGRCLYLATCITLRKLCVFDTFWLFTMHTCTDSHTLTLVLANCTNEESKMPLYQHHWIKICHGKVRYEQSPVKKIYYLPLLPPLSLPLPLLWTAKVQKDFSCCLEGKVGYNIKVRYARTGLHSIKKQGK